MTPEDQQLDQHASEFWEEQEADTRHDIRRQVVRWILVFTVVLTALAFTLWWATSAVRFSAARVQHSAEPAYVVSGQVRDAVTGAPVPWPRVFDDPSSGPPHFEATGNHEGMFELSTLAEPHRVHITALGYETAVLAIGRRWYRWMPKGVEKLDVQLHPESKREN